MTNTTPISLCSVDECERPSHARGYCAPHYSTWHRSQKKYSIECKACGKKVKVSRSTATTCSRKCAAVVGANAAKAHWAEHVPVPAIPLPHSGACAECGADFESLTVRKYCSDICRENAAAERNRAQWTPLRLAWETNDYGAFVEALEGMVRVGAGGCWIWTRKMQKTGYPVVRFGKKNFQAHRLTLEMKLGKPLGVQAAHHRCGDSRCVNPEHLQPVTERENIAEMLARNSYVRRIRELEAALAALDPANPVLDRAPLSGV